MIYQIPVDQITGLAKYGLALSCTAVSDLAESDLARYAPPSVRCRRRIVLFVASIVAKPRHLVALFAHRKQRH